MKQLRCLLHTANTREVINDANGYVCNFWRDLKHDPNGVLEHVDWPVVELDQYSGLVLTTLY